MIVGTALPRPTWSSILAVLFFLKHTKKDPYTKVINTNARDAVHVIDGLLHHETDLQIEKHYTDTAGYTDQVFGLTNLLGFRFAPRLRDLADPKLYTFEKPDQYPEMEKLLRGRINTKIIQGNYDDVLRLAHSIREGTVSASLIMGKLGSYSLQNSLATTLREVGRIDKTLFIFFLHNSKIMIQYFYMKSKFILMRIAIWPGTRTELKSLLFRVNS